MADEKKPEDTTCPGCGEDLSDPQRMARLQRGVEGVFDVLHAESKDPYEGIEVLVNALLITLRDEFEVDDPQARAIDIIKSATLIVSGRKPH